MKIIKKKYLIFFLTTLLVAFIFGKMYIVQYTKSLTSKVRYISELRSEDIYKTVTIGVDKDIEASKIFYNYVLNFWEPDSLTYAEIKEEGIDNTYAFFIDFNDDGVDEIMGLHFNIAYSGSGSCGWAIEILKKTKNGYKNINSNCFYAFSPIVILNHKTDGYKDILSINSKGEYTKKKYDKKKGYY